MKKLINFLGTKNVFRYKVGYIRDGKQYWVTDWKDNLILDSGLDKLGTVDAEACFRWCLFGNQVSPDPVARNSGAITFTTVGAACTASANFFSAADVGRLIKFDDAGGQERYITAFTSATLVTLGSAPSPAIAANTATVWYVNQTALQSDYSNTNSYQQNGGDNGTSWSGGTRTMKRTYIGAAVVGSVTLTEIGFNNTNSNASLFDRDIIVGGVGLINGDQPTAIAQFIQTFTPTTPVALGNVATGFDSSGDFQLCWVDANVTYVQANGNGTGNDGMEPPSNSGSAFSLKQATFTIPAFNTSVGAGSPVQATGGSLAGYTPGSFFRDKTASYDVTRGNGTNYGIIFGFFEYGTALKFTTPFIKLNTQTLDFTFRWSWQRILHN